MRMMRFFAVILLLMFLNSFVVFPFILGQRIERQLQAQLAAFPFPDNVTITLSQYQRHWLRSTFNLKVETASPVTLALLAPYLDSGSKQATLEMPIVISHGFSALAPNLQGYLRMGEIQSTQMVLNGRPWAAQLAGRYGWKYLDLDWSIPEGITTQMHLADWQLHGRYDPAAQRWMQSLQFPKVEWQQGSNQLRLVGLHCDTTYSTKSRGLEWLEGVTVAFDRFQFIGPQSVDIYDLNWAEQHTREGNTPWMHVTADVRFSKMMFSDETVGPFETKISVDHVAVDALRGIIAMYPFPESADTRIQTHWEYHISQLFEPQPEINVEMFSLKISEGVLSGKLKSKIAGPMNPEGMWVWENWVPRTYMQLETRLPRLFVLNLVKEMQRNQLVSEIQIQKLSIPPEKFDEIIATRSDTFVKQLEVGSLLLPDTEQFYMLNASLLGGTVNLNGHPVFSVSYVDLPGEKKSKVK